MRRIIAAALAPAAALSIALAAAAPAGAEMTLKQFRNYSAMPGGGPLLRSYLSGLRDGLVMLQDMLEARHGVEPTFCPQGDAITKGTGFEELLHRELADPSHGKPWPADMQMSRIVTRVLQAEFPCRTF